MKKYLIKIILKGLPMWWTLFNTEPLLAQKYSYRDCEETLALYLSMAQEPHDSAFRLQCPIILKNGWKDSLKNYKKTFPEYVKDHLFDKVSFYQGCILISVKVFSEQNATCFKFKVSGTHEQYLKDIERDGDKTAIKNLPSNTNIITICARDIP